MPEPSRPPCLNDLDFCISFVEGHTRLQSFYSDHMDSQQDTRISFYASCKHHRHCSEVFLVRHYSYYACRIVSWMCMSCKTSDSE
ncbi:hypothetical protein BC937DRAFT_89711 [Endogone sp. FLAS-F59071]|nr:hypothetical protein BC937DRAFT_89711 [Endogone sp. FLAS-F59071]|eukprot:RUS17626.1 hypothetical protein BC937DRAFT_89711 [Endogone sp. FLAS-F59071]